MDLSIFEQALSLRAEVEKAELDAAEPDFRQVVKEAGKRSATGANAATVVKPPEAPNEKLAMKFMMRGAALAGAAAASAADGNAAASDLKHRQSRIADMLRAASEPLAEFDPNAKGVDISQPPSSAPTGSQPTETRPPVVGAVATHPVETQPVETQTPAVVVRPLSTQPRPIGMASRAAESKTQAKTSTRDAKSATSTASARDAKRAKKSAPSTPTTPTPKKKR